MNVNCREKYKGRNVFSSRSVPGLIIFDQVEHETMYASIENKHFFAGSCHSQTYQNYEQSRQKLGTILVNKVP